MSYTILILVLAIIQQSRGNQRVWTTTVHQVNFFAPREGMNPGMVPQQQVYSPQPMVRQPLPQQMLMQYAAITPPPTYSSPPPQQVTPINTGYAQPPVNTTRYLPDPANTRYTQDRYTQDPESAGYTLAPAPANIIYPQGPTNPGPPNMFKPKALE